MIGHEIKWESKHKLDIKDIKRYIVIYYDQNNCIQMKTNFKDIGTVVGLTEILNATVKKPFNGGGSFAE